MLVYIISPFRESSDECLFIYPNAPGFSSSLSVDDVGDIENPGPRINKSLYEGYCRLSFSSFKTIFEVYHDKISCVPGFLFTAFCFLFFPFVCLLDHN
jgi:hypothetical protein